MVVANARRLNRTLTLPSVPRGRLGSMPDAGKLTDIDDAILTVVYQWAPRSLTFGEIRKALQTKGYDLSEKEIEAAVQQLRNLGYLSTKKE